MTRHTSSDHPQHRELTVASGDDGQRLDRWLKRHAPEVPYGLMQKWLRKGAIRVNRQKAKGDLRLQAGQQVSLPSMADAQTPGEPARSASKHVPITKAERRRVEEMLIEEDDELIVINKSAGLSAQGGSKVGASVDSLLRRYYAGRCEPRLIHRLDRDTSGVMVMAKHREAAAQLSAKLQQQQWQKTYWAVVVGVPTPQEGSIILPLAKEAKGKHSRTMPSRETMQPNERGKYAETQFRVLDKAAQTLSWLEMTPITGRTHQLRVHSEAIGHPIVGDGKYGGNAAFIDGLAQQLHLHARTIEIPRKKGKTVTYEAPLPPHMKDTFALFGFTL